MQEIDPEVTWEYWATRLARLPAGLTPRVLGSITGIDAVDVELARDSRGRPYLRESALSGDLNQSSPSPLGGSGVGVPRSRTHRLDRVS